jgi:hypothetical protein
MNTVSLIGGQIQGVQMVAIRRQVQRIRLMIYSYIVYYDAAVFMVGMKDHLSCMYRSVFLSIRLHGYN